MIRSRPGQISPVPKNRYGSLSAFLDGERREKAVRLGMKSIELFQFNRTIRNIKLDEKSEQQNPNPSKFVAKRAVTRIEHIDNATNNKKKNLAKGRVTAHIGTGAASAASTERAMQAFKDEGRQAIAKASRLRKLKRINTTPNFAEAVLKDQAIQQYKEDMSNQTDPQHDDHESSITPMPKSMHELYVNFASEAVEVVDRNRGKSSGNKRDANAFDRNVVTPNWIDSYSAEKDDEVGIISKGKYITQATKILGLVPLATKGKPKPAATENSGKNKSNSGAQSRYSSLRIQSKKVPGLTGIRNTSVVRGRANERKTISKSKYSSRRSLSKQSSHRNSKKDLIDMQRREAEEIEEKKATIANDLSNAKYWSFNSKKELFEVFQRVNTILPQHQRECHSTRHQYLLVREKDGLTPMTSLILRPSPSEQTSISIPYFSLGDVHCESLANVIQNHPLITELNLRGNRFTHTGLEILFAACSHQSFLQKIELSENSYFGEPGCIELGKYLKPKLPLLDLRLSSCRLGDRGIFVLHNSINFKHCRLQVLHVCDNQIGIAGGKLVADMLGRLNHLQVLDVSWNNIRGEAANAFPTALSKSKSIRELNLSHNSFRKDAYKMGAVISKASQLELLDLSYNSIRSGTIRAMRRDRKNKWNQRSTVVKLDGNQMKKREVVMTHTAQLGKSIG